VQRPAGERHHRGLHRGPDEQGERQRADADGPAQKRTRRERADLERDPDDTQRLAGGG